MQVVHPEKRQDYHRALEVLNSSRSHIALPPRFALYELPNRAYQMEVLY
jgi:hypothetical protein